MNKKLNVLVTGCGGDIGQSVGKILSEYEHVKNLFGMDISNRNAAQFIYPNFSVCLGVDHPEYIKTLEAFVDRHDIDIVVPVSEPELRYYSDMTKIDSVGSAKLITASSLAMEVGFDKFKTAEFLRNEGLPFPKTYLASCLSAISCFPVILKSKSGSGSNCVYKIDNMDEFCFYTRNDVGSYIVQDYLSDKNGEFTCGLFGSTDGQVRSIILKRELSSGYSGYGEVVENTSISNLLERLAVGIDLVGSINVQLRIDDDTPKIFEINPRFSSTVLFRHLFGFKDLIWSIEDALGYDISDEGKCATGRKFYKGFEEYVR